jgi:cell division protein FtsN
VRDQAAKEKAARELAAKEKAAKEKAARELAAKEKAAKEKAARELAAKEKAAKTQPSSREIVLPKVELIGRAGTSPVVPASATAASKAAPTATAGGSSWIVQVGSFAEQQNADKVRNQLRTQGFSAFLSTSKSSSGSTLYRVRIGPQGSRTESEKMLQRLQHQGFSAQILSQNN